MQSTNLIRLATKVMRLRSVKKYIRSVSRSHAMWHLLKTTDPQKYGCCKDSFGNVFSTLLVISIFQFYDFVYINFTESGLFMF